MRSRSTPTRRHRSAGAWLCIVVPCASLLAGCAADRNARIDDPAPIRETRTGVPVLMDLPGIGWLFGRRVTSR